MAKFMHKTKNPKFDMKKILNIKESQLAALKKRLDSGKPITAAQMAFVERFTAGAEKGGDDDSGVASNLSDLARRLGVSRQLVAWHNATAAAPDTFSVSDWREYLILHGKGATRGRVESSSAKTRRDSYEEIFCDGLLAAHGFGMDGVGDFLNVALSAANLKTTPKQRDTIAIWLWIISAARVHRIAMEHNCPHSPLTGVEFDPQGTPEENDWCPPKIRAAAKRIGFNLDFAREHFLGQNK